MFFDSPGADERHHHDAADLEAGQAAGSPWPHHQALHRPRYPDRQKSESVFLVLMTQQQLLALSAELFQLEKKFTMPLPPVAF